MNQPQAPKASHRSTFVEVQPPHPGGYISMKKKGRRAAWERFPTVTQRNAEMLRRYSAGDTLASIAAALGYTRERVRQIVKFTGAVMPRGLRCAVEQCERSTRAPRLYCGFHQRLDPHGTQTARVSARVNGLRLSDPRVFTVSTRNEVRRLREQGHAYKTVARLLNEAGVCAPRGGAWHATSVRRACMSE
jgi:hypothetical protein